MYQNLVNNALGTATKLAVGVKGLDELKKGTEAQKSALEQENLKLDIDIAQAKRDVEENAELADFNLMNEYPELGNPNINSIDDIPEENVELRQAYRAMEDLGFKTQARKHQIEGFEKRREEIKNKVKDLDTPLYKRILGGKK